MSSARVPTAKKQQREAVAMACERAGVALRAAAHVRASGAHAAPLRTGPSLHPAVSHPWQQQKPPRPRPGLGAQHRAASGWLGGRAPPGRPAPPARLRAPSRGSFAPPARSPRYTPRCAGRSRRPACAIPRAWPGRRRASCRRAPSAPVPVRPRHAGSVP